MFMTFGKILGKVVIDNLLVKIITVGLLLIMAVIIFNLTRPKSTFESCNSTCRNTYKSNKNVKALCFQLCLPNK